MSAKKAAKKVTKIASLKKQTEPQSKKITFKSAEIGIDNLLLDPNNYRFLDNPSYKKKIKTRFHDPGVQEATRRLLEKDGSYQLTELKKSILTNGYVPMERIIVTPYQHAENKFVVVEGNRRVAAIKSLLQEDQEGVRTLPQDDKMSLSKIPCAILEMQSGDLKHAERVIMGIRHIAGPKEWGAYQQAQLITELHDEEGETFTKIGEHLGISAVEVSRRYRAMKALHRMEGDEFYADKATPDFYRLFHELVASPDVRKRFGWDDQINDFTDEELAREFFELIAPENGEEAKLKTYMDVRRLKAVVHRPQANAILLDPDKSLNDALRFANEAIEDESFERISVGQLCADLRAKLERLTVTDLAGITRPDLRKIDGLVTSSQKIQMMAKRYLEDSDDATSPGD